MLSPQIRVICAITNVDVVYSKVALVPMDAAGKEYFGDDDELFVEDSEEMIGKPLRFNVKLVGMNDLPKKYHVSSPIPIHIGIHRMLSSVQDLCLFALK